MDAPPDHHAACLQVLYCVAAEVRVIGWATSASIWRRVDRRSPRRIVDLMNATHNIPVLLRGWDRCDVSRLRADLRDCDERWRGERDVLYRLDEVYEEALTKARQITV